MVQASRRLISAAAAVVLMATAARAYTIGELPNLEIPNGPVVKPQSFMAAPPGATERSMEIMKYGWPGHEAIKEKESFVLSYDRRFKTANWACEKLTAAQLAEHNANRRHCRFHEDLTENELFRAKLADYRRSGYDRGHQAPAGDHPDNQEAMCDTFVLSNMSPQVGKGFNRDKWRMLEERVRDMTQSWDNVYVCTGPLYLPTITEDGKNYVKFEVVGKDHVAVPTHFYKVVLMEKDNEATMQIQAYILPNVVIPDDAPLDQYKVQLQE
eukprot:Ihof_evm2s739 gene=Ihof_evmTU2s739